MSSAGVIRIALSPDGDLCPVTVPESTPLLSPALEELRAQLAAWRCSPADIKQILARYQPDTIQRYLDDMPTRERIWPRSERGRNGEAWKPGRTLFLSITRQWNHVAEDVPTTAAERKAERERQAENHVPLHNPLRSPSPAPASAPLQADAVRAPPPTGPPAPPGQHAYPQSYRKRRGDPDPRPDHQENPDP